MFLWGVRANDLSGDEDLHGSTELLLEFERSSVISSFIFFTARCDDSTSSLAETTICSTFSKHSVLRGEIEGRGLDV